MANKTLNTRIVTRNDTSTNWTINKNKVLLKGEIGLETDTGKYKVGDGSTTWGNLTYYKHIADGTVFGLVDDVKVDGTSVVSSKIANVSTINGDYDANTNKLATAGDLPTQASDVGALPDTTKYGASLSVSGTTVQLKDQDGTVLSSITTQDTDTGATTLSGNTEESGKAFVSASYNASNRTITFQKGTFLTQHQDISGKQDAANNTGLDTADKTIVGAINEVNTIAKGASQAIGFTNYSSLINELNSASATKYKTGQSFYIQTLNVPDLWVLGVESSSSTYNYTTDEAFITATSASGGQQVGYYTVAQLETQKVDLTNYVQTSRKIAGVDLVDDISKQELLAALNVTDGAEPNAVDSVNGKTGAVVLNADDIDDTNTTNKFVTASEKSTWSGKQDAINSTNKLSADLVDDTNTTNKFVTDSDKTAWNNKQDALTAGAGITINNNTINAKGIFYCEYGSTTYNEIADALNAGLLPVCITDPDTNNEFGCYVFSGKTGTSYQSKYAFTKVYGNGVDTITVDIRLSNWTSNSITLLKDADTFILDGGNSTT